MIWICYALSWLMVIPWMVYATQASQWPTSEQNNYKLLDWARWVLTLWVIVPMFWLLHFCIVDGLFCNRDNATDKVGNQKKRDNCYFFFWILDLGFGAVECYLAVMGIINCMYAEDGYSTWFWASVVMMDIFCWLHFAIHLGCCCCIVGLSCFAPGNHSILNIGLDRHYKMLNVFHPQDNKNEKYVQPQTGINYDTY